MSFRLGLPISVCALLAGPGVAAAAGAGSSTSVPIRIELDAPPGCASAEDFYAALRARSEQVRLGQAGERATEVVVKLEPGSDVLHGELRVIDEHGDAESRTVDGSSCEAVLEALSLTAALAFEAAQERKLAETPQSPPPERTETPPDEPLEDEAPGDQSRGEPRVSLGALAVVTRVLTEQTSVGAALTGRVRWEPAAKGSPGPSLGLTLMYASSAPLESSGGASSSWTGAMLSGCPAWVGVGAVTLAPCLVASGGVLTVSGLEVENPRSVKRSWWSVGAQLSAEAELGEAVALDLAAGVSVPLVERTFVTTPSETLVSSTPRFSPLGSLGLSYKFR